MFQLSKSSKMRKQYIHLILIILISSQSQMFTQSGFKVMEIDNSEYPKMKSNYYLFDQLGLPIRNLKINDFVVRDNGVNVKSITNHYCDATNYDTTKLSVTLSFDLALNTDGDFNNFELGKRLSKNIASKIDYNEISLVSYNIRTYLNREFTDTLDYILSEINNFNPDIGSLFNTTFLDEPANVFKIISRANYKKIIILITDGSGNIEENLINTLADDNNIKIYSLVIGKKIPESLKRITIKSGGIFIDNINPNIDFDLISNIINAHGKGYLPCQLDWESDYSCTEEHYINVSIPSLSLKDSLLIDFPNLEKSSIIADPSFLGFSSVDSGKTKKLSLTITAKNRDIFIQELKINQPFTIIEGNVSNYLLLKDNFLNNN